MEVRINRVMDDGKSEGGVRMGWDGMCYLHWGSCEHEHVLPADLPHRLTNEGLLILNL